MTCKYHSNTCSTSHIYEYMTCTVHARSCEGIHYCIEEIVFKNSQPRLFVKRFLLQNKNQYCEKQLVGLNTYFKFLIDRNVPFSIHEARNTYTRFYVRRRDRRNRFGRLQWTRTHLRVTTRDVKRRRATTRLVAGWSKFWSGRAKTREQLGSETAVCDAGCTIFKRICAWSVNFSWKDIKHANKWDAPERRSLEKCVYGATSVARDRRFMSCRSRQKRQIWVLGLNWLHVCWSQFLMTLTACRRRKLHNSKHYNTSSCWIRVGFTYRVLRT